MKQVGTIQLACVRMMSLSEVANMLTIRLLSALALVIGVGARVYAFCDVPPGLNQDEASIGYEAWSLLHYGVDRNGFGFPVHLVSWGSGQNALYAYLDIPFVAFGLSAMTVRLPMLITAIGSLGLVWIIARRLFSEKAAWCATAIVALSPWHIMLSRWALESNLLPFMFLSALSCFVIARDSVYQLSWLILAGVLFGLSLYAYGPAYVAVPLFVMGALALGIAERRITVRRAALVLATFVLVGIPILLFVLINMLRWHSISVAGATIPLLPVVPRIQTMLTARPLSTNADMLWQILVNQSDDTFRNVTDPYGILYSGFFLVLAVCLAGGAVVLVVQKRWPASRVLVAWWLIAALPTGLVQPPNINRVNLLLMGLVFAAGVAPAVLDRRLRGVVVISMAPVLIWSGFFIHTYFVDEPSVLAASYPSGLLSALRYVQTAAPSTAPICVTGKANMPYIFALFSERTDPRIYLHTVTYIDARAPFREVTSFGRYTFDLSRCNFQTTEFVVTARDEIPPDTFEREAVFSSFSVFARKKT